ncbi:hypothetical protein BTS2_3250 [Bacillus sp. TS-2]|nr:hypothetical protein BTS2_3250 [Bacillus sp. TS-2]
MVKINHGSILSYDAFRLLEKRSHLLLDDFIKFLYEIDSSFD